MKKLIIILLSLTTLCFAKEGAADELARLIFLAIFVFVGLPAIIYAVIMPIVALCTFIDHMEKDKYIWKINLFWLTRNSYNRNYFLFLNLVCYTIFYRTFLRMAYSFFFNNNRTILPFNYHNRLERFR